MRKSKLFLFFLLIFVFTLFSFWVNEVKAGPPEITITPQSSAVSTNVNYCFGWSSTSDLANTDSISIDLDDNFDTSNLSSQEVYLYLDSLDCGNTQGASYEARQGEWPETADNNRPVVMVLSGDSQFILNPEDSIADSTNISIGLVVDSGDTIITPASAGSYPVTIVQYVQEASDPVEVDWFDEQLLYIGDPNDVQISGEVDPSISLSLDSWKAWDGSAGTANTCDLGTLTATNINTCSYIATINTNATSGYTASIEEDQAMTSGSDVLDSASGTIVANDDSVEAYGISTTQSGQTITQINDADSSTTYTQADCDSLTNQSSINANASSLSTSSQTFASSSTVASDESVSLCHAATIASTTPAGLYNHTITITLVGNF